MEMEVLAVDFDGVLSDSARESYVVAVRTYLTMRPNSTLAETLTPLGEGAAATHDFESDAVFAAFRELMPLGNRAEDYAVTLAILEAAARVEGQDDYDVFYAQQDGGFLRDYHVRFYEVRRRFKDQDPTTWRRLQEPFPGIVDLLRRRVGTVRLAIATAKDRSSTSALLTDYGIADLFAEDLVLDKEAGVTKTAHLEQVHRRTAAPYPAITFVDDKVNHLESVAFLGVRCVLAAWGYNGPREQRRAADLGFAVATLTNAERVLFG